MSGRENEHAVARRHTQEERFAGISPEAQERLAPPRSVDCNITLEKLRGDHYEVDLKKRFL